MQILLQFKNLNPKTMTKLLESLQYIEWSSNIPKSLKNINFPKGEREEEVVGNLYSFSKVSCLLNSLATVEKYFEL